MTALNAMAPTVGRMVHYLRHGHEKPSAAVIIDVVSNDEIAIEIFGLDDMLERLRFGVMFAETPTQGCWNWPPRV